MLIRPTEVDAANAGMFFGIYSRSDPVRLVPVWLEGREVIAVFEGFGEKAFAWRRCHTCPKWQRRQDQQLIP